MKVDNDFSLIVELYEDDLTNLRHVLSAELDFALRFSLYCRLSIRLNSDDFLKAVYRRYPSAERLSDGWIDNVFWLETMENLAGALSRLRRKDQVEVIEFVPTLITLVLEAKDDLVRFTLDDNGYWYNLVEGVARKQQFVSEVISSFQHNVNRLKEVRSEAVDSPLIRTVHNTLEKCLAAE